MTTSAPPLATALTTVTLRAAAFDVAAGTQHPNKMPFSGVLTYIDEPSDAAPEGSGGRRVMITAQAAESAVDTLVGMAIDCEADFSGHAPQNKIGVISAARIETQGQRKAIVVDGFIYAADFPDLAAEIKASKANLGMSFEARDLWTPDPTADPISIIQCVFTGAAILFKDRASYKTTSISAAAAEIQELSETLTAIVAKTMKPIRAVENHPSQKRLPSMKNHDALINAARALGYTDADLGKLAGALSGGAHLSNVQAALDPNRGFQVLTPMQACEANPENIKEIKRLRAACSGVGYDLDVSKLVDLHALNKAIRSAPGDNHDRAWMIKTAMFRLGLLAP